MATVCSSCGTENKPGRRFCVGCGSPLAVACPACGALADPGDRFCGECATPLAEWVANAAARVPAQAGTPARLATHGTIAAPAGIPAAGPGSPASALVAERRLVSILFADLVGFTGLSADRDPEETRELLGRYFELAREVVGRYGGTIEKFIGDAVMTVWGAPVAHEDDAERAVRAGLDLVAAVPRLHPGLEARAAVLTGEAAVTLGATGQGIVAGDLVNTASRLQSVAEPGTVLVGETTRRATGRAIVYRDAGERALKGKERPLTAWQALRVVAERGGRNRAETLEAPFVGRDEELRLLKDLFHATGREGRARLVSVIGPAGIGKTRLAWEFLKYVDGLVDAVWWHDGRSPAYGDGITFRALGEMIRGRSGLREADDEATTRSKVAEAVAEHVADDDERRWIEPALLALLGIGSSATRPEEMFGAWRTFFERLATTAPVVMVFEDFHHADPGLLDFVDHLLEWSRGVPIYVITLARPDLLERRPDWGAGKRSFTSVHLEPLPEPAVRALLAGLVPGLPEPAVRAIVERAGGIPLYAIETIRMLVADGRLVHAGDAFTPAGDLTTLEVPETLHALIAARLDALPAVERALLSDAAVIGMSFTPAALASVSGRPEAEIEGPLRALLRRELLVRQADPRSPERGQFAFVQPLIREVAYSTLARRDRTSRHLAAARFFEALGSDELAGALAGHYLAAHRQATDPGQASALAAQARIALSAAAERAATLGSHDQAIIFLRQALEVTDEPGEQAALLERLGETALQADRPVEARDELIRALDLRERAGDRGGAARCAATLAGAIVDLRAGEGGIDEVRALADRYLDLLDEEPGAVELAAQLSRILFLFDRMQEALDVAERTLRSAERLNLVDVVADLLVTKGTALASVGREYEGLGVLEAGLRLAEARGGSRTTIRAQNNLGYMLIYRDPPRAEAILAEGAAAARRIGDVRWAVQVAVNVTGVLNTLGRTDDALAACAEIDGLEPQGPGRWWVTMAAAMSRLWRGELGDAELAVLVAETTETSDPQVMGFLHWIEADADFLAGRYGDDRTRRHEVARTDEARAGLNLAYSARSALMLRDRDAAAADLAAMEATLTRGALLEAHGRRNQGRDRGPGGPARRGAGRLPRGHRRLSGAPGSRGGDSGAGHADHPRPGRAGLPGRRGASAIDLRGGRLPATAASPGRGARQRHVCGRRARTVAPLTPRRSAVRHCAARGANGRASGADGRGGRHCVRRQRPRPPLWRLRRAELPRADQPRASAGRVRGRTGAGRRQRRSLPAARSCVPREWR